MHLNPTQTSGTRSACMTMTMSGAYANFCLVKISGSPKNVLGREWSLIQYSRAGEMMQGQEKMKLGGNGKQTDQENPVSEIDASASVAEAPIYKPRPLMVQFVDIDSKAKIMEKLYRLSLDEAPDEIKKT